MRLTFTSHFGYLSTKHFLFDLWQFHVLFCLRLTMHLTHPWRCVVVNNATTEIRIEFTSLFACWNWLVFDFSSFRQFFHNLSRVLLSFDCNATAVSTFLNFFFPIFYIFINNGFSISFLPPFLIILSTSILLPMIIGLVLFPQESLQRTAHFHPLSF